MIKSDLRIFIIWFGITICLIFGAQWLMDKFMPLTPQQQQFNPWYDLFFGGSKSPKSHGLIIGSESILNRAKRLDKEQGFDPNDPDYKNKVIDDIEKQAKEAGINLPPRQ